MDPARELRHEPVPADPGLTRDHDNPSLGGIDPAERVFELGELGVVTHQRRPARHVERRRQRHLGQTRIGFPADLARRQRNREPLQLERTDRNELEAAP